jgi:hypothetical protein
MWECYKDLDRWIVEVVIISAFIKGISIKSTQSPGIVLYTIKVNAKVIISCATIPTVNGIEDEVHIDLVVRRQSGICS